MIDYASIKPMMSLSTFILLMMAALFAGRVIVELADIYGKKKSPRDVGRHPASQRRQLSPSQKSIQRYYNRKGA